MRSVPKCGLSVVGSLYAVRVMVYCVAAQTMTGNVIADKRQTLGGLLREARLEADYSISRLARELEVDSRTVARWQADQSVPSITRLGEIARVLKKPMSFFFDTEEGAST